MAKNLGAQAEAYPVANTGYANQYPPAQPYAPQQPQHPPYAPQQQPYAPQQQPYAPQQQPYQQPYHGGQVQPTVVAQPYNGPVAQEAVATQVSSQAHVVIVRQGQQHPSGTTGQLPPSSHCFLAWFSCLCCCCPIGLFAVISAWSVRKKWESNDLHGAFRASEMARNASFLAIVVGLIWQILTIIYETESSSEDNSGSFSPAPSPRG